MKLTHFDDHGNARMVDVSEKVDTVRQAVAEGFITLSEEAFQIVKDKGLTKGDVLSVAQLAAIMGAKETSNLIPLCHPLFLTKVDVDCFFVEESCAIGIRSTVKTTGPTGVEMEALTAVQVGLLTVYDMCKAVDQTMTIGPVYVVEKQGGRRGHYERK